MAEPIVFISRHRIVEGRRDDLARAYAGAVDLIRATKPATALFAAYLDQAGAEVRIVHAFRTRRPWRCTSRALGNGRRPRPA